MLLTGPTKGAGPVNGVQLAHVTVPAALAFFNQIRYDKGEVCLQKQSIKLKGKEINN
jgi:hypothetical protein